MTDEEQRRAFEQALLDNIYEEANHRAYADWLYEHGEDALAEWHALWTPQKQEGVDYLTDFAAHVNKTMWRDYDDETEAENWFTYEDLVAKVLRYLDTGATSYFNSDFTDRFYGEKEKFWEMFERVTGRRPGDNQSASLAYGVFRCSC